MVGWTIERRFAEVDFLRKKAVHVLGIVGEII
jgi:hypothetical protein